MIPKTFLLDFKEIYYLLPFSFLCASVNELLTVPDAFSPTLQKIIMNAAEYRDPGHVALDHVTSRPLVSSS